MEWRRGRKKRRITSQSDPVTYITNAHRPKAAAVKEKEAAYSFKNSHRYIHHKRSVNVWNWFKGERYVASIRIESGLQARKYFVSVTQLLK